MHPHVSVRVRTCRCLTAYAGIWHTGANFRVLSPFPTARTGGAYVISRPWQYTTHTHAHNARRSDAANRSASRQCSSTGSAPLRSCHAARGSSGEQRSAIAHRDSSAHLYHRPRASALTDSDRHSHRDPHAAPVRRPAAQRSYAHGDRAPGAHSYADPGAYRNANPDGKSHRRLIRFRLLVTCVSPARESAYRTPR